MAEQPRVPAGSPQGGQWASSHSGGYLYTGITPTDDEVGAHTEQWLGKKYTRDDMVHMAGMPAGTVITMFSVREHAPGHPTFLVRGESPDQDVAWEREFDLKNKVVFNHSFDVDDSLQGKGIGRKSLAQQVEAASAAGFNKIRAYAAGHSGAGDMGATNGYYTWPRLGFMPEAPEEIEHIIPKGSSLPKLMSTPEGRKFWKENGHGHYGVFDLTPDSMSRRVLDAYLKEKS